ncbi:hypothetical protein CXG81DRAFT_21170 [Caulochytrium protostelioides]|uniref:Uncharacterized protein n=1 Tax=Caulochytrium protostelioides TaxID=1555241 RepID=A0A4P9WSR4_9FUNG|nr:hypothetical protein CAUPRSCDRAFT_12037 [Caulochytrium protostelioides]RKO98627.1 hypothetical protein CXG81DRAFT_21170 [Caulochytrium protostelioides]|eukprot:RKO98627.1 hypothetical protein CXG81DRAFT_21170 [Caulochytrium protostelioides]
MQLLVWRREGLLPFLLQVFLKCLLVTAIPVQQQTVDYQKIFTFPQTRDVSSHRPFGPIAFEDTVKLSPSLGDVKNQNSGAATGSNLAADGRDTGPFSANKYFKPVYQPHLWAESHAGPAVWPPTQNDLQHPNSGAATSINLAPAGGNIEPFLTNEPFFGNSQPAMRGEDIDIDSLTRDELEQHLWPDSESGSFVPSNNPTADDSTNGGASVTMQYYPHFGPIDYEEAVKPPRLSPGSGGSPVNFLPLAFDSIKGPEGSIAKALKRGR